MIFESKKVLHCLRTNQKLSKYSRQEIVTRCSLLNRAQRQVHTSLCNLLSRKSSSGVILCVPNWIEGNFGTFRSILIHIMVYRARKEVCLRSCRFFE